MSRLTDTADLAAATRQLRRAGSTAAVGIAVIGVLAGCSASPADTSTSAADTTSDEPSTASSSAAAVDDTSLKDGTYTESADYQTPGGTESVTVTLTLASGTITKVSTTGSGTTANSKHYLEAFESGISDVVVGKKIATLNVGAVSGSSLTPNGFNDAVAKIITDATKA